jgi:outer membrane protein OmpA-like peptidoglycan-associated protein
MPEKKKDDFSKTENFINKPKKEASSEYHSSWEKTNYLDLSAGEQKPSSDWEKTRQFNTPVEKYPEPSWQEKTRVDLYLRDANKEAPLTKKEPSIQESAVSHKAKTTPDSELVKSGIPTWIWYAGIAVMFILLAGTIVLSYLLFSKRYGFDVILVGAHQNSDVFVDGVRWGISSSDGSIRLIGLRAGEHRIEVKNPEYLYDMETVRGIDGEQTKVTLKYRAKNIPAKPTAPVTDECSQIKKGEFEKAAKCANEALDKLGDKFTIEELLRAMNLYIINFDSGKYDIKPKDMKFLERAASYIKKVPPNVKIEVGGHTDNVGADDYNMKLSENRAKAVRDALVSFGVDPNMLEVRGYGKTKPKASNDTEDGRFQNRRIEYTAIIR